MKESTIQAYWNGGILNHFLRQLKIIKNGLADVFLLNGITPRKIMDPYSI